MISVFFPVEKNLQPHDVIHLVGAPGKDLHNVLG